MMVGYRWFQNKNKEPLFPFGFGLSYTNFTYSNLRVDSDAKSVTFELRNIGKQQGDEIAEVYVTLPTAAAEPFRKLAGWQRISMEPDASKTVVIPLDPLYLSIYSTADDGWRRISGEYQIEVGGSSANLPLHKAVNLVSR
jgi:beta-glucosidase